MYKSFIIISLSIFFLTCKKAELPPQKQNNPVFSIRGTLNGDVLEIIAGEENYILSTSFEKDNNDVYTFIGTFAQIDCGLECKDTFRIKIRDFNTSASGGVNTTEAFKIGNYLYRGDGTTMQITKDTISEYSATFDASTSIPPNQVFNYSWMVDTMQFSSPFANTFSAILVHDISNEITASLTISNNQSCNSTQTKTLLITPNQVGESCSVSLSYAGNFLETFLIANSNSMDPVSYSWSNGASSDSILISPVTPFGTEFLVTATDANGCVAEASASYIGQMGANNPFCIADFSSQISVEQTIKEDTTFIPDPFQFSTITIEYTDENGEFYSTELGEQNNTNSLFSIIFVEEFEINENGNPTKKLGIEFNCILYAENGSILNLNGGEGVIGVAYPE